MLKWWKWAPLLGTSPMLHSATFRKEDMDHGENNQFSVISFSFNHQGLLISHFNWLGRPLLHWRLIGKPFQSTWKTIQIDFCLGSLMGQTEHSWHGGERNPHLLHRMVDETIDFFYSAAWQFSWFGANFSRPATELGAAHQFKNVLVQMSNGMHVELPKEQRKQSSFRVVLWNVWLERNQCISSQ